MALNLARAFVEELRQAVKSLRRSGTFVGTVVATLSLGIGANVAMFDAVDRLMFRPLAYLRDADSVHRFYLQWQSRGGTITGASGPYTRLLDFQKGTSSFSAFAGFSERDLAVGEGEATRERRVSAVSASYFDFFEARPALGRFFDASEDVTPMGAQVAVLSNEFWQSGFGGRNVVGEILQVGNMRSTIIGVAPPGFAGVNDALPPEVFVPITAFAGSSGTGDARSYFTTYKWGFMNLMARRKPGVTVLQAEADATRAFRQSWEAAGPDNPVKASVEEARPRVTLSSLRPGGGPDPSLEARTAWWLGVVALIVLIIAGANVANLILARSLERQQETAVRLALGVGRQRLALQAFSESVVLAALSGAGSLIVGQAATVSLRSFFVKSTVAAPALAGDPRSLFVALLLTFAVAVALGLIPTLLLERGDVSKALRGGARGGRTQGARLRGGLLVAQAALSVILIIGAALFVRSLDAVRSLRLGYDVDRVLLVTRVVRGPSLGNEGLRAIRDSLLSAASALQGVESAAWVSSAPFVSTSNTALFVDGVEVSKEQGPFTYQATTADYFKTMGTRVIRGRELAASDRYGAPNVAVIGESMARALWPGQEAIGRCMRVFSAEASCTTVVGIAEDMFQRDLAGATRYHYYMPIDQFTRTSGNGMLLRLRGDPAVEAERIRQALQKVMPAPSYVVTLPLRSIVDNAQRSWRMGATLFMMFGFFAVLVAAVGLRGALAYSVTQRARELSVRVALGAQRNDLLRLILGQGLRVALLGSLIGVGTSFAAAAWIQPLLFQQPAVDGRIYLCVAGLMLAVALGAGLHPALRAAGSDPAKTLRTE